MLDFGVKDVKRGSRNHPLVAVDAGAGPSNPPGSATSTEAAFVCSVARSRFLRARAGLLVLLCGCGAPAPQPRVERARSAISTISTAAEASPQVAAPGQPPAFYATLVERAERLAAAKAPPAAPRPLPAALREMSYDAYRSIRFRPERSLWRNQPGRFEVQLFHLGFYFRDPVAVHVVEADRASRVAFSPDLFSYDGVAAPPADARLDFAGLRLHAPLNTPKYRDEVIVFLGASYFRALGRGQVYGLSARGLAIDTGEAGPEEFPRFSELYLVRPGAGDEAAWVLALLESARATGAYAFRVAPGDATVIDVTARIWLRQPVAVLGLAPLTSMYLFGEEQPARFGDFRPEVHDSDGLALLGANGEWLFRPLRNPPRTTVCSFRLDSPRGFGLLQRDRSFASYQDLEARYQDRPSAWVEPIGDWGKGAVRLLEITSDQEIHDNIAALWVPDEVPAGGLSLRYRLHLGGALPQAGPAGRVTATRQAATKNGTRFLVDFAGEQLGSAEGVSVEASATHARIVERRVEANPFTSGLRAVIDVVPERAGDDVELRAFLRRGTAALSETWSYLWQRR